MEKRKVNLYSIGDASNKGNVNTRIEIKENGVYLRINVGTRQYIYALVKAGDRIKRLKTGLCPTQFMMWKGMLLM